MKKLIFISFILFSLVVVSGCNARKNTVRFDSENADSNIEVTNDNM